jgi:hypothetical protein
MGERRPAPEEKHMTGPSKVLFGAFLSATALAVGAAAYSQTAGSLWDSTQLPETRGIVKQYTLTPRGDVDGLILNDGTEVTCMTCPVDDGETSEPRTCDDVTVAGDAEGHEEPH